MSGNKRIKKDEKVEKKIEKVPRHSQKGKKNAPAVTPFSAPPFPGFEWSCLKADMHKASNYSNNEL